MNSSMYDLPGPILSHVNLLIDRIMDGAYDPHLDRILRYCIKVHDGKVTVDAGSFDLAKGDDALPLLEVLASNPKGNDKHLLRIAKAAKSRIDLNAKEEVRAEALRKAAEEAEKDREPGLTATVLGEVKERKSRRIRGGVGAGVVGSPDVQHKRPSNYTPKEYVEIRRSSSMLGSGPGLTTTLTYARADFLHRRLHWQVLRRGVVELQVEGIGDKNVKCFVVDALGQKTDDLIWVKRDADDTFLTKVVQRHNISPISHVIQGN